MPAPEGFKFDKTISLAIIGTLLVQTFMLGWTLSSYNSRIGNLETAVAQIPQLTAHLAQLDVSQVKLEARIGTKP